MKKSDLGIGVVVAAMAVCCGLPILLLALPVLAAATGQLLLIVGAVIVAAVGIGMLAWRRRCGTCALPSQASPEQAQIDYRAPDQPPAQEAPVAASKEPS